jgi:single-strand DNA-binding protein
MASLNKVLIIGNLGKDPEERFFPDGSPVTNLSVACTEKYKDKLGEKKEVTEWVNLVYFGKLAEVAAQYLNKGSSIYAEGKLKTERYTDNKGIERFATKVIGSSLQILTGKPRDGNETKRDPVDKPANIENLDEDIPF